MGEALAGLLAFALLYAGLGGVRLLMAVRRRRRCFHTRYLGQAGVVCLACQRERRALAEHLRRASGSGVQTSASTPRRSE